MLLSNRQGTGKSNACLSVVGTTLMSHMKWTTISTFYLKCHMVCLSVTSLYYRITCLWLCNKRGVLLVPDPVFLFTGVTTQGNENCSIEPKEIAKQVTPT